MHVNAVAVGVFVTLFIEMTIYIVRDVIRKSRNNKKNKTQGGK